MNPLFPFSRQILGSALFFLAFSANTSSPLWTFEPLTPTTVGVFSNGNAIVKYKVTNQSKRSHILALTPTTGINQLVEFGYCSTPFVLGSKDSCTLALEISGSGLRSNILGGPIVCQQGSALQCYQPSAANSLNISIKSATALAAGFYGNGTYGYPLLAQSTKNGTSWIYSIDSSNPPSDLVNGGAFNSTSCNAGTCIAAGSYSTITYGYPLLAQSTNSGMTWTYSIDSSNVPSDFVSGEFRSTVASTASLLPNALKLLAWQRSAAD
jgi:hypothetical protein